MVILGLFGAVSLASAGVINEDRRLTVQKLSALDLCDVSDDPHIEGSSNSPVSSDRFVKIFGQREEDDKEVFFACISTQPAPHKAVEVTRNFTVDFFGYSRRYITQIAVTKNLKDDLTSTVTLTAGGPSTSYATFFFKNEVGKPVSYKVEIFAKNNHSE